MMDIVARGVSVGRDALGNVIVTGDRNVVRVTLVVADQRLVEQFSKSPDLSAKATATPYRGLDAFYETNADFFFGRTKLIRRAWVLFQNLQRGNDPRILAVVGGSGSGKSSLVRAGFLPELARSPIEGLQSPTILVLRPGRDPIDRLLEVLDRVFPNNSIDAMAFRAPADNRDFGDLLVFLTAVSQVGQRFVIVIDQFEELYTECTDLTSRNIFLKVLEIAASDAGRLVSVVLTLRSDFAGSVSKGSIFGTAIREHRLIVQAMDSDELNEAISRPALELGHPWPQPLVEALVSQTEGRAGALPLLQFALKRLWPEHLNGRLNEASWSSQLIEDFLVQSADALYDATKPSDQSVIRRAFLAMVQLGEGAPDTRRVARLSEFMASADHEESVRDVLAPFSAPEARLITTSEVNGEISYELTHEALIASWDKLRGWLGKISAEGEEARIRDDLRLQRRFFSVSVDWKAGRGGLWRPPELSQLEAYAERSLQEFSPLQIEFLEASRTAFNEDIARQARMQARIRRSLQAAVALSVILLIAAVASGLLWIQASNSEKKANETIVLAKDELAKRLLERGDNLLTERPELSVRFAQAAFELSASMGVPELLRAAANAIPIWRRLPDPDVEPNSPFLFVEAAQDGDPIAVDPDFKYLLAEVGGASDASDTSDRKQIGIFSIDTGALLSTMTLGNNRFLSNETLTSKLFGIISKKSTLRVFELENPDLGKSVLEIPNVQIAAFSSGDWPLITIEADGFARMYKSPGASPTLISENTIIRPSKLYSSKGGQSVAVVAEDASIIAVLDTSSTRSWHRFELGYMHECLDGSEFS